MKRTNIYLPERQLGLLRRVSESQGRPVAELVRDALDSYLAAHGIREIPEDEWGARFDALLARRRTIAERERFTDEAALKDVSAVVHQLRRKRAARRR
jgi:hypothetical protein